ncbi:MAG: SurA N-terminal domain-containing protein [Ornithinimicrobium sp.]
MTHRSLTRFASAAAAVALAAVLTACSADSDSSADDDSQSGSGDASAATSEAPAGEAAAPEADLEGLPEVVAEVDGEEISREDFVEAYEAQLQQASLQAQQTGTEVDQETLKQETAENLVSNLLLVQAADAADIAPTDEEVNATLDELATSNGAPTAQEFLAALEDQGFTEAEVRDEIRNQLKIEQYITQEAEIEAPSEDEVRDLYDTIAGQEGPEGADAAGQTLPPFEEVQPQLQQQLDQEAQSAAVQTLLEDLRANADVTTNL